jgi:hypothetical protein
MAANPYVTQKLNQAAGAVQGLNTNKVTGIIIWLVGAWLTSQTLGQLKVPDPLNIIIGLAIQLALTKAESPVWKGKKTPLMGVGAIAVDTSINSSGAWPYVKNIGDTDFWTMIRDIAMAMTPAPPPGTVAAPPIEPTIATIVAISVGCGLFTAAAAEYFWNLD